MLTPDLRNALAAALATHPELETVPAARLSWRAASGGCINQAGVLVTPGGEYFVKVNARAPRGMFRAEAAGLAALGAAALGAAVASPGALRIPRAWAVGGPEVATPTLEGDLACVPAATAFLLLEYLPAGRPGPHYGRHLGAGLAALHRTASDRFGFPADNYLGSTPQPNDLSDDWVEFFATRRLEHQARLARDSGRADGELGRLTARLIARLDSLIAEPAEPPALVHGDLWGGNHQPAPDGAPMLFDPAPYFARREVDLAMTELFGGFEADFHAAYRDAWPVVEGYEIRREIYNLYHLMNHLNLFGGGYGSQVMRTLRRFAG